MNYTKYFHIRKHKLALLVFLFTTIVFAQNKFREGSDFIVNGNTLQDAFYQCVEKLGKPTLSQTDDALITAYCFKTPDGNIILGKNSITKKFEGAIIWIKSETEGDWISNHVHLNSNIDEGRLYLKNSKIKCEEYIGGNKKVILIAFGDTDFAGKIPMTIN